MAIKNIIAKGVGFLAGAVKWIVTHGFGAGVLVPAPTERIFIVDRGTREFIVDRGTRTYIVNRT